MIFSRFVSETKLEAEQALLVFNLGKDLLCTMLGDLPWNNAEINKKLKIKSYFA